MKQISTRNEGRSTAPLRIFLVEDSADVRDLIVEGLGEIPGVELAGYSETEEDAVDHLAHEKYDVLILDIQLRQGNGMHLLQTLPPKKVARSRRPRKP